MQAVIKALIIDLDGVVYRGNTAIPGVQKAIEELKSIGKLLFLTNNATLTRADYVKKLDRMGIKTSVNEILTSAYAAAVYLERDGKGSKVYAIGEKGLKSELKAKGFKLLSLKKAEDADYVVVGLDRKFNYKKLTAGLKAILKGAKFIATNTDATWPYEKGVLPGAGSMVAALEACSKVKPIVIGKPSRIIMEIALEMLEVSSSEVLVVGDRLETDILAGKLINAKTALVLTGVTSVKDVEKAPDKMKPDLVVQSLAHLPAALKNL